MRDPTVRSQWAHRASGSAAPTFSPSHPLTRSPSPHSPPCAHCARNVRPRAEIVIRPLGSSGSACTRAHEANERRFKAFRASALRRSWIQTRPTTPTVRNVHGEVWVRVRVDDAAANARACGGWARETHTEYIIEGGFAALLAQARAQRGLSGKRRAGEARDSERRAGKGRVRPGRSAGTTYVKEPAASQLSRGGMGWSGV